MSLKTRSGVKKRVKVTGSGKFKLGQGSKRHLLSNKSKKSKKRNINGLEVSKSEAKKIREQLPHM